MTDGRKKLYCDSSPVDDVDVVGQLIAEMFTNTVVDTVAPPQLQRMRQTHLVEFGRAIRLVDARDPRVTPPVREQAWIVEAEDVDVRPVNEVERQNAHVTAGVFRSDDSDARWIVPVSYTHLTLPTILRV